MGLYAQQAYRTFIEKESFAEQLRGVWGQFSSSGSSFLLGDWNARSQRQRPGEAPHFTLALIIAVQTFAHKALN
eukprot:12900160-Prorocentrum_lima.AAC.2